MADIVKQLPIVFSLDTCGSNYLINMSFKLIVDASE